MLRIKPLGSILNEYPWNINNYQAEVLKAVLSTKVTYFALRQNLMGIFRADVNIIQAKKCPNLSCTYLRWEHVHLLARV